MMSMTHIFRKFCCIVLKNHNNLAQAKGYIVELYSVDDFELHNHDAVHVVFPRRWCAQI